MTNKNIYKALKASTLLFILILALAITPSWASGQIAEKSSQDETKISEEIAAKFLKDLGYEDTTAIQFSATSDLGKVRGVGTYSVKDDGKPTIISVTSNLQINNGNSKSFNYSAKFASIDGKKYSIDQSYSQIKRGNVTTTIITENIVGALNLYSRVNETKTSGILVNKQTEGFLNVNNASESYSLNFTFSGVMNPEETVILNGTMNLDQNKVEPTGHYIAICSPKSTELGSGTKVDIIFPNGTLIDPGIDWFASNLWSGNNALYGVYLWWELLYQGVVGGIIIVLSGLVLAGVITAPFAPLIYALDVIIFYSSGFCSSMESDYGPIYIMYASMVCYLGFIPYYGEIGFFTDRIWGVPLGDWYYIPQQPSGPSHTCIWPPILGPIPDPPLTVLCYDESTSSYIANVPLTLNGTWNQKSGYTVDVPPGIYVIEMENYEGNSFHYFDVDGQAVYENPATITIGEEDVTITVHYYYLPTYSVTVLAQDTYVYEYVYSNVYIDGQYAGATGSTFTMKPGFHAIEVDSYGYSYYWECGVPFLNWWDPYGSNTITAVTINSDFTIGAIYNFE